MNRLLATLAALLLVAAPSRAHAQETERVVVLPVENLTTNGSAGEAVAGLIADAIARKGYTVIQGEVVERFLEDERIRYLDALPTPVAQRMLAEMNAQIVVTSAVYTWAERPLSQIGVAPGMENPKDPEFALTVTLQDRTGAVVWSEYRGLTGEDTAGPFQLGRRTSIDSVSRLAIQELFGSLPGRGEKVKARPPRGGIAGLRTAESGRARSFDPSTVRRICILPIDARPEERRGATIVAQLLAARLREIPGVSVVSQGDLRAAMVAEGIRTVRLPSDAEMLALSRRLSADVFVTGALYEYKQKQITGGQLGALVNLYLSLASPGPARLLWSGFATRNSEDYMGLFQVVGITDGASLADQTVAELVNALFPGFEIPRRKEPTP